MKPVLMKTVMSACGKFFTYDNGEYSCSTMGGEFYDDIYNKNISEFYLNEAKERYPQYEWKVITFEIKEYEKDTIEEIPELTYYRDMILYNKNFNDTFTNTVGKKFKFKDGELQVISFNPLPTSIGGIMYRNNLNPYDQESYNFQGFFTNKDGVIEAKCFKLDYLLENITKQEVLDVIKGIK